MYHFLRSNLSIQPIDLPYQGNCVDVNYIYISYIDMSYKLLFEDVSNQS